MQIKQSIYNKGETSSIQLAFADEQAINHFKQFSPINQHSALPFRQSKKEDNTYSALNVVKNDLHQ